ncbi:MAG: hypothetical protein JXR83_09365 [Deltaproteobacteria bacterium]|nr:hypothetical protein [Deltaproteobacteria bacterium]
MLSSPIALAAIAALAASDTRTLGSAIAGLPRAIYAADVTADGNLDAVVVIDRAGRRRLAVLDGAGLERAAPELAPRLFEVPDDAAFFGVCPSLAAGIVLARPGRLEHLPWAGAPVDLPAVPGALPFAERGDLPLVEICPPAMPPRQLLVPTLGGAALVAPGAPPRSLDAPLRAYLTSGTTFRGPRARRDFSLLAMVAFARPFAGDLDGDGGVDLATAIEDELTWTGRDGRSGHLVLPLRSAEQRRSNDGLIDTRLCDLTGDGVLDAVVTYQRGGSNSMRTSWRVLAGPLAGAPRTLATIERQGLAAPLLIDDVDLDGRPEIVEPLVDVSLVAMGKALVTGSIPIQYRVHRFADGKHSASAPLEIAHAIDFSRATNLAGHPPLLGGDFDGDGRGDLVALATADELTIHRGVAGDPPFASRPTLRASVPSTHQAVSLRRGRSGAAALVFVSERDGGALLTVVQIKGERAGVRQR